MADSRYATNLRKERQRFSNKLKKEQADHATAVNDLHRRWIEKLARNLSHQQQLHGVENATLQKKFDRMEVEISKGRLHGMENTKLQKKVDRMEVEITKE